MKMKLFTLLLSLVVVESASACMHYPTGMPKVSDHIFCGRGFAVGYNFENNAPDWIAYTASDNDEQHAFTGRFHINRNIPERYQASPEDYLTAYEQSLQDANEYADIPHQYPTAEDEQVTSAAQKPISFVMGQLANPKTIQQNAFAHGQTYSMYSILPIRAGSAEALWQQLSEKELFLVQRRGKLHVITGGIYQDVKHYHGKSGVAIPSHFWRVFYDPTVKKADAYLIPNQAELEQNSLEAYLTSVDNIEQLTELDLFNRLDHEIELALELNSREMLN